MGLLDNFSGIMDDPQTMGLLGAAGGMLQASGPSRMPVSFGQALGAGLTSGTSAYNSTRQIQMDRQKEQMQMQMLQQQVAQATRKNELINNFLAQNLAGGPQSSPANPQQPGMGAPMADMQGAAMPTGGYAGAPAAPASQPSAGGFGGVPSSAIAADLAFNNGGKMGEWINDRSKPTDFARLLTQSGIDPNSELGRQMMQQHVAKENTIPLVAGRAGAPMFDNSGRIIAMAPKIPDNAIPQIQDGRVVGVSALPGAAGVDQINAYASAAGKGQATPMAAVDGNGQPVFTNQLRAAGGGGLTQGAPTPDLNHLTPQQRDDLMARAQAQFGLQPGSQPGTSVVRPAAAPGFAESQTALAGAGAKRYTGLIDMASDSNTRVNVYDNILNLSREGVKTGPSAEWNNKLKGYAGSIPGVDIMFPGMQKDVSNYQEINKFMYQNAQRNWQAAGGTGTDSQLEAFSKSSPNSTMFPQALKAMAEWGKAGELALQGKANAAQTWKDSQGGNVVNQDQFERAWRNSFDPQLFQLKTMEPGMAAQYVANLKKTNPTGYATLMMKATALKNIGGL